MKSHIISLLFIVACALSTAFGQQDTARITPQQVEELRHEIIRLRTELSLLRSALDSLGVDAADQADRAQERLERKITQLENKIDAISRAGAPTVLNPRTTAFINFAGRADSKTVYDATGTSEISNRPFLRSAELDLQAPVDPYADAVAILSLEDQAGKGYSIDAEEAYGVIKKIPILEEAPLGVKLKIGKFRAPIGTDNKVHMHDLPWTTRPLAVARYLGTEHGDFFESGFNPVGMDLNFFLPSPVPSTTFEMNLDVVRSGDIGLSGSQSSTQPAYIGHLNLSRDWDNEHLLVLGGSVYDAHGANAVRVWNVDLTYKWAPLERRESNSFVAGGELFICSAPSIDSARRGTLQKPLGWFGYAQYQFSYWTYAGVRYDRVKEPSDDRLSTQAYSAYVSYYTTEFLRLRLGFQHLESDVLPSALNNVNSLIFDVNLVFGSHPAEPYWVNR